MNRLMLVDDEANMLSTLRRGLLGPSSLTGGAAELEIEVFDDPRKALARAESVSFDLVISDYRMPHMNGVEFLTELIKIQPNIARLILSGYADLQGLIDAINRVQIFRFIAKPWHDFELRSTVKQALMYRELLRENQRLADTVRMQQGILSRQEMELKRLEEQYPHLNQANRSSGDLKTFNE